MIVHIFAKVAVNSMMNQNPHVQIQRGGGGAWGPDPLENYKKNIGFLSNTGPHLLKITKLPSQHSMLGHNRPTSETPFKWCFAGGPLMIRL